MNFRLIKGTFFLTLISFNLTAQDTNDSDKAIELYVNEKSDSALLILNKIVQENPNDFIANQYLGYIWFEKFDYDSTVYYLTRAIKVDPTVPDLYFVRGISNLYYGIEPTANEACNDFRKAKSLGYENTTLDSLMKEKCWKHDNIYIQQEGLYDSAIIDNVYKILPPGWSIYHISDQKTLSNSNYELDISSKYSITITNQRMKFIDPIWSSTDEVAPEITIRVIDKKRYKSVKNQVRKTRKKMKSDEILPLEIYLADNFLLLFKFYAEHRFERSKVHEIETQYFKDKKNIISNFVSHDW